MALKVAAPSPLALKCNPVTTTQTTIMFAVRRVPCKKEALVPGSKKMEVGVPTQMKTNPYLVSKMKYLAADQSQKPLRKSNPSNPPARVRSSPLSKLSVSAFHEQQHQQPQYAGGQGGADEVRRRPDYLEHPRDDVPAHHHVAPGEAAAHLVQPAAPHGLRDGGGDDLPARSGVAGAGFFPAARFSLCGHPGTQVFGPERRAGAADQADMVQQGLVILFGRCRCGYAR